MSTPDGNNILVGSGVVYFNRRNLDNTFAGFRHLGNVSKLEVNPAITTIEKKSSMDAARATIQRAITETKAEVNLTLDEFDPNNVAIALLGDVGTFTQSSSTATDSALGTVALGFALDTGKKKITVTSVKKGGTTFVLGTDYTVDSDAGLITFLAGGTVANADVVTWSGSVPALSSAIVHALSNGNVRGAMRFVSSADQVGPRTIVDIWDVAMSPNGAISLIADQFGEIGLQGNALPDATKAVGQRFAQVIYL